MSVRRKSSYPLSSYVRRAAKLKNALHYGAPGTSTFLNLPR